MSRPLSIFLSSLVIFGMVQQDCQVLAQPPKEITNSIGMKLVLIPKGTFVMGSPESEEGRQMDETQHEVTISKDYYLGVTEVTQGQYQKVMGKNPSYFQKRVIGKSDSSMYPVEQVSWEDAVEFCKKLSDLPEEKKAVREYRLPTEAEWEYACRAGTKTAYSFGADRNALKDFDWFGDNSGEKMINLDRIWEESRGNIDIYLEKLLENGGKTHPVGAKKANPWGLYDMHGNVCEWCSDWIDDYPKQAITDPIGPKLGSYRVRRGGSLGLWAASCRSAFRSGTGSSIRSDIFGFRVALSSSGIPE